MRRADFSIANGERSGNGDDDRMAVVALEMRSGNRMNENPRRHLGTSCLFRNGPLTAPYCTYTPPPEMPLYVHILIHLLYSTS